VTRRKFGALLRSYRQSTVDPTTGQPYTVERAAERLTEMLGENVSRTTYGGWELGKVEVLAAPAANAVCRLFSIPSDELLRAMGFDLGVDPLTEDERRLLAVFRRYRRRPDLQQQAIRVIQALPEPRRAEPRTLEAERRVAEPPGRYRV
jgi:hypothetical protein